MEAFNIEFIVVVICVAAMAVLFMWVRYVVKHAPLVCDCFEGPREYKGERIKCQWEQWLDAEIKAHAITRSQLVAAVGDLGVANAEVSRLNREMEYLQTKYERLKEKERVTVLPSFSELCTDPARMVFSGEEVVEDTAVIDDDATFSGRRA